MWYHLDLSQKEGKELVLGRMATRIAKVLMGKHLPTYSPHLPGEDYVVVNNIELAKLTGNKVDQKEYITHSGYVGSLKRTPYKKMKEEKPEKILYLAVSGMLPKNRLRDLRLKRLKLYTGSENPHEAQKCVPFPDNI